MTLTRIKQTYQEVTFGYSEPDLMGCNGKTLLDMCEKLGDNHPLDVDGNEINPSLGYWITPKGIVRMDD